MDFIANTEAKSLLGRYEIFKDGVNWLQNTVLKTFFKYVKTHMISKMKNSSEIDDRRKLIRNFAYIHSTFSF